METELRDLIEQHLKDSCEKFFPNHAVDFQDKNNLHMKFRLLDIISIKDGSLFRAEGWVWVYYNDEFIVARPFSLCFKKKNKSLEVFSIQICKERGLKTWMERIVNGDKEKTDHIEITRRYMDEWDE